MVKQLAALALYMVCSSVLALHTNGKSVIVIGTGFSGMGAATDLYSAGFKITMLES